MNPCPGHMDFSINITIKGITEDNGLFRTDELAGSAAGQGTWNGWDGPAMEQIRYLSAQDWYQVYGINTTDLFVRNPLTSAEIDIYMTMVPENTSRQKKDFIRYALSSVLTTGAASQVRQDTRATALAPSQHRMRTDVS